MNTQVGAFCADHFYRPAQPAQPVRRRRLHLVLLLFLTSIVLTSVAYAMGYSAGMAEAYADVQEVSRG
jgi:hypothetical protein